MKTIKNHEQINSFEKLIPEEVIDQLLMINVFNNIYIYESLLDCKLFKLTSCTDLESEAFDDISLVTCINGAEYFICNHFNSDGNDYHVLKNDPLFIPQDLIECINSYNPLLLN